jgi:formate dehydrogenase major subunit
VATVTLTIDGRTATVDEGRTVLEAARSLGIEIPTLCHVEGLEPVSACFLCCVQVEGTRTLSPSCALPAADGMVVTTASDDIRAARRTALELLLSDHAGECVAPCAARCPAGLDVPGFVYEIASGENGRAMERIHERLSLPGSLGRVCPRLCEQSCRRCEWDHEGLAIGALHRHAADRNLEAASPALPRPGRPTGKSVAIIGAGPAGLTAAFYLLQQGHACTLFDAHPLPGGMLRYGIPEYRLPRAALDAEIRVVAQLGAAFRMNRHWGRDFSLADLRREHDAVFLAIGAQRSSRLHCEGADLALSGIGFLREVAEGGRPDLGRRVVVIGGGNTAMDCARTARRLGAEVRVLYRRTRREMPCLMEEVEGAEAEGVAVEVLVAPVRVERGGDGRALRLVCQRMELGEPDESGRRRPVPVVGSDFPVECDAVVAAVGQAVDRERAGAEGLALTDRGLAADPRTLATTLPGVFAGGDAVLGADLAVRAVAAGRVAAVSIDQYLSGRPVTGPEDLVAIALRPVDDDERAAILREIEKAKRVETLLLEPERRTSGFEEIDRGLDDERARREALRCLSCGCAKAGGCGLRRWATAYLADPYRFLGRRRRFDRDASHPEVVYEPGKCVMCDACVRIAAAAGEDPGLSIVGRGFDVSVAVPFGAPLSLGLRRVARQCAEACPTGAIALRTARACDLAGCGGCGSP